MADARGLGHLLWASACDEAHCEEGLSAGCDPAFYAAGATGGGSARGTSRGRNDLGTGATRGRDAGETAYREEHPLTPETVPQPVVTPQQVYVSCDGIMYGTRDTEPDPLHPGQQKQVWRQMRVGCVYWQDEKDRWQKQMIWGQELDYQSFGRSLYELAIRHGYLQAEENIFAADGGPWCRAIKDQHFADAEGIHDSYHASEHVWACAKALQFDPQKMKAWAQAALSHLWQKGCTGLLNELLATRRASPDAALAAPI